MYGQMTAGSWIYIGTQGILQGTYETFAAAARKHFGGTAGRQAGRHGRHGRDGRRAAAGGHDEWRSFLGIEADPERIKRRVKTGYCDMHGERSGRSPAHPAQRRPRSAKPFRSGLVGNCAEVTAGNGAARHCAGPAYRSDQRARSAERLYPTGYDVAQAASFARRSQRIRRTRHGFHCPARARDARFAECWAQSHSTTGTTSGAWLRTGAWVTLTISPALCPSIYGRCFAKAAARSAG